MIAALHAKRNRPYLHMLVFVLLMSWISLIISATCIMPMPSILTAMSEHMPGCPDAGASEHYQSHTAKSMQDCAFKPCLDSQTHSLPDFSRLAKPDLPVIMLSLLWTISSLFLTYPPTKVPHKAAPPSGRRIPLIYRFCTLLN